MAPVAAVATSSSQKGAWRPTKIMNMEDLSRDDDFLSHLLVEKLGTGDVPLVVHKMDPARRLPKTNAEELLQIVRRMVAVKGSPQTAIRQAVDELLRLNAVKYYLKSLSYDQKQVNAFATHASRYFELYLPGGSIEIAHTSRYTHRTGKSELCILATRPLHTGTVISELKGSMADLTEDEDKELKRTDGRHADGVAIRRDFSVIHSKQMKKNHLFLGPARFVNHDCDHNVELFREGRYITFRVIRMIGVGEEVTAHYGDGYFGDNNCHCLCATCEKNGRGGYGPQDLADDVSDSGTGSVQGADSETAEDESDGDADTVDVNERRTRRGVYVVLPEKKAGGIELPEAEPEVLEENSDHSSVPHGSASSSDSSRPPLSSSDMTSLPPTSPHSSGSFSRIKGHGLPTPEPDTEPRGRGMAKGKGRGGSVLSNSASPGKTARSRSSTAIPFKSVISTRAQKAREAYIEASTSANPQDSSMSTRSRSGVRQLVTPPLTSDSTAPSATNSVRSSSRIRSRPVASAVASSSRLSTPVPDRKGKGRATESVSDARDVDKDEPEVRHLRPRAPVPVYDQHGISTKKPLDAPRGLDGKPLPICVTCSSIIPVISVDSKVVWGLSLGRTGKRGRPKKNLQVECPRCIRHFNIYARKWPERIAGDGSLAFVPLPRPSASVTPYVPPAPVKKAVQSGPSNKYAVSAPAGPGRPPKRHLDTEDSEATGAKKRKTEGRPRGRPPKNKVGMSEQAKKILKVDAQTADGRRSGRARVPSLKLRESESPLKLRLSPRKNVLPSSPLTADSESPEHLPESPPAGVHASSSSSPKSLAVAAQPREVNGRFGKKDSTNGRFMRRQFHVGAKRYLTGHNLLSNLRRSRYDNEADSEDGSEDAWEDHYEDGQPHDEHASSNSSGTSGSVEIGEEALEDMVLKRPHDADDADVLSPKRIRIEEESGESDISPQSSPRFLMGAGSLLRPNPISFARRKWATVDDDDDDLPSRMSRKSGYTVDDRGDVDLNHTSNPNTVESADTAAEADGTTGSLMPAAQIVASVSVARLTVRPSPMNLARRRWAPLPSKFKAESESTATQEDSLSGNIDLHDKVAISASPRRQAQNAMPTRIGYSSGSEESGGWYSDDNCTDSDSEFWSEDEEYLKQDSINFRRAMSLDGVDSADDSERMVERLLDPHPMTTDSTLPALTSRNPSTPPPMILSTEKWKQTVLIPSDASRRFPRSSTLLIAPISPSPRTLTQAGWDTGSSDIEP